MIRKALLEVLYTKDAYLSESFRGSAIVGGAYQKVHGHSIPIVVYRPQFESLKRHGLIERGKRVRHNHMENGWFLSHAGKSKARGEA